MKRRQPPSDLAASEARVLPFKRRAPSVAPPRRRRRNPWFALAGVLGAALAAVGIPLGLVLWVLSSPRFALRTLDVEGGRFASNAWTRAALQPLVGSNLAALRLTEAEARLLVHPWVETVELRKILPDRLAVRVIEKLPAALVRQSDGLGYVDRRGVRIAAFEPSMAATFGEFFLISGEGLEPATVERAIRLGRRLEALRPDWGRDLSEVEALSEEDFRVVTAALPFPFVVRFGSRSEAAEADLVAAIGRLERLVPELEARYEQVESVDLRGGRRVIVRPAAA